MNNTLRKCLYSYLLLLASLIVSHSTFGQDLTIHPTFNNMYGGGSFEDLYASFETSDGGFILGGKAFENATTGNISDPFCGTSNSDFWIVKTDIDGNTEWDTLFGGTGNEALFDMIETSDGGYALVGQTLSMASCDVPAGNLFVNDAWVVKIDALGNILWTSRFGSVQNDNAKSIIETSDGGFLIGGDTTNLVEGAPDYWITKLDGTTGAILWDNSIGGDDYDILEVVRETTDGFFLGGYSFSEISKDKTAARFGSFDYWIVKVDLNGNYVWDLSYGGTGNDQLFDMEVTSDGGLILAGFSESDPSILPNNKTAANIGGEDCWAIKVNSAGVITWDQSYGGVDQDRIYSVEIIDLTDCVTNYIFGGITSSGASGDVTDANIGGGDYWLNFVDASGNLIWEKNYGGDQYEEVRDFRRNSDGSYIVGGYTISDNNGDVPSTNFGAFDNWAFKLSCNFDIPDLMDEEVCDGESITLTAMNGACDNCTYQWDANGGNATTNSITVTPTDTTTYTVIVTNANCCADTTSTTVIWYPSPTVDLGSDTEICPGESIPLDATTPNCTYAWSTSATTPIINPTMAGTYSVTITCEFGCTATDEITINPGIIPTVDLGNNTTLCEGDSMLLDAGVGGMNYNWSTGDSSQMIYGNDETDYCVTVTSVDGCSTIDCISLNYDTVLVVLPNDTMLCPSETLVVSAGNNGCIYNWSNGPTSQSITVSSAGIYTVTVTCGTALCTSVDEIVIGYFSVNSPQNISAEICQGDSLFVGGAWQFMTGNYSDTYLTADGCDSIVNTSLVVNPVFSQNVPAEICQGDSLFIGSIWQFTTGSYSDTLMTVNGCDSIIITDLTVNSTFSTNVPIEICQGETYFAQGVAQNMTGTYFDTLMTVEGCDSVIITDLIVHPTFSQNVPVEICQGETYFAGGAAQNTTGSYPDTLMTINGCDSIIVTDLIVNPIFLQNIPVEICQGDSLFAGGDWQFINGSYPDTLITLEGCDSIIITDLIINPVFLQNVPAEICQGDSLFVGGIWQFSTGSYSDTLMTVEGCDSIIITDLIVNPTFSTNVPIEICQGETYFAQGAAQNMTGTYFDTLMTVEGCDSVIITDLIVHPSFLQNVPVEICQGETYFAQGAAQTTTGSYSDTLMTVEGCDSIIITDLVVNPIFSQNIPVEICQGDSLFVGGDWQFINGSYPDTLITLEGCDSIIITDLIINPVFLQNVPAEICQGDSLFVGGIWQFSTGSYSDTLMTVEGCDSIIITDLIVNPTFSTNVPIEICQGETYFAQGAAQNMTGTYFDTLMTVEGCDSVIITDLIVHPTFSQNVPVEICQGETYFAQGAAQTTTGSYSDTLMTVEGCDSIIITDLVVNPIFSQNIPVEICQGDSLFVGGDWQFINGNYPDTLITIDGCDSIIITDLVVNDTFEMIIDTMICNSTLVGLDTIYLFSQNGCDSNIIYNFILIDLDTFTFEVFTCDANLVDTTFTNASGTNGECDSVLVNITSLAPSYEINIDTTTCIASQVGLDTIFMNSIFGCDSNLIFNFQLIDADSFFFQNFTCDANLVDTTFTNASGTNGECDSVLVNITSLAPSYEINIDTTTCIASQVGLDTIFMNSIFGCDSNLIFNFQLIDADSFFFQNFTCDANLVDTTFTNASGTNGECDSVLVNITSLAPSYEINIDTTTCIASQVGLDTIFMNSIFGCDSNLIFNFQLIDADSFFFQNFICDANLVDTTFTNASGTNGACDSILVNITSLAPSYEINIDTTTCIASQVGLDTIFMNSIFGCDSTVIFNYELLAADTFLMSETTCDSTLLGTTTMNLPGMNGECDSILITNTTFACDTIYLNSISCNPLDTGIFIQITGSNTIIDSIGLAPTDSTYLTNISCNPLDTGLVLTSSLQNVFGCDSLIFTYTSLLPSQNILMESTTCDASQVGILIDTLQNQFGCDSIITNSISLLPSSIDTILTLSCFIDDVGTDTLFIGTNSLGCDSLVLAITEYEQVIESFISFSDISCFGESDGVILIDSVFGGTPPYLYSLDNMPFQNTPIFTNLPADNYTILIEDADGCQTLAIIPLNSINEIIVDLGDDLFINIGDSATIFAQINIDPEELDTIIWTTIDSINCSGNCLDFTVIPFQTTTYSIMVMDENGCSSQDEITVNVDENIPVYIPNAFSPNEDNYNDKITIFGNAELIEEVQFFRIFDRWGELVFQDENFQPNDPGSGWDGNLDGKPMNPAVFIYFAEVRFIDGTIKQFKGDITLVR